MSLCKTCDPLGWDHFLAKWYNLNKLGRGPIGDAGCQISRIYYMPCGFRHEEFFMFSLYNMFLKGYPLEAKTALKN